ncbi:FAD/NAD(P)-binding domain-containing protein [Tuber magnatum]|uniref:FAD/NAD(P)-binding domain-containing protein n=1 Tax=Tuber magnatum TaxID=42249 RepID=A0A317SQ55_9PEZI|nr:FAD/NAD(P)-binding domain-containing protein [Tuber magnatum]
MSRKKVIIIGAGITGQTLALTILKNPLLREVYEPILLDRQTQDTYAQGAGVVLSSNALHPLIRLGLEDELWKISQEVVEMSIHREKRYLNSMVTPNWSPDIGGGTGLRAIERGALMKLLVDQVCSNGGEGYIVLLDVAGLSAWPLPGGKYFWTITVPETSPPTSKSTMEKTAEYPNATIVTGGYPLSSTLDTLSRLSATPRPSLPGRVCAELCQRSSRIVRALLYQLVFEQSQIANATPNVVLTGDAARVMLPTSGQGACMGIEDATVLANSLLNSYSIGGALAEYASLRVPRSKSIASQAYWSGIVYMAEHWVVRTARDWLLSLLPKGRNAKEMWEMEEKAPRDPMAWLYSLRLEVKVEDREGAVQQK